MDAQESPNSLRHGIFRRVLIAELQRVANASGTFRDLGLTVSKVMRF